MIERHGYDGIEHINMLFLNFFALQRCALNICVV